MNSRMIWFHLILPKLLTYRDKEFAEKLDLIPLLIRTQLRLQNMFHQLQPQVGFPYHVLVSARPPMTCSPVAACAVAATSPYYYFWLLLGCFLAAWLLVACLWAAPGCFWAALACSWLLLGCCWLAPFLLGCFWCLLAAGCNPSAKCWDWRFQDLLAVKQEQGNHGKLMKIITSIDGLISLKDQSPE